MLTNNVKKLNTSSNNNSLINSSGFTKTGVGYSSKLNVKDTTQSAQITSQSGQIHTQLALSNSENKEHLFRENIEQNNKRKSSSSHHLVDITNTINRGKKIKTSSDNQTLSDSSEFIKTGVVDFCSSKLKVSDSNAKNLALKVINKEASVTSFKDDQVINEFNR
jgi:hypothetical protein